MARLNDQLDSDDELPDLSTILRLRTDAIPRTRLETPRQEDGGIPSQRGETRNLATDNPLTEKHAITPKTFTKVSSARPQARKQRLRPLEHLKPAHIIFPLLPTSDASVNNSETNGSPSVEAVVSVPTRASPRESVNGIADYSRHHDDCSYTDLSGFIVPDSATDGDFPASGSPKKKKKKQKQKQKDRTPKVSAANPHEPGFRSSRQSPLDTQIFCGSSSSIYPDEKNRSRVSLESLPSNEPFRSELVEAHPNLDDRLTM